MADRWRRLTAAAADWLDRFWPTRVGRRAALGFAEHHGGQVAAGMAYFAILSLFQLVVLGVVVVSLLVGEGEARQLFIDRLAVATPVGRETIEGIVDGVIEGRGGITVASVALLAWGGYGFIASLAEGIRRAIPGVGRPPFWRNRMTDLLLIVGAAVLVVLAVVIGILTQLIAGAGDRLVTDLLGLSLPVAFAFVALLALYRAVPNSPIRLAQALPGAVVGTALWTALRLGFTWYATDVARYDVLFGPISAAIGLLVFLYLASMALLIGAEIVRANQPDDGSRTRSA